MKMIRQHFFTLAIFMSILIHFFVATGGIIPELLLPEKATKTASIQVNLTPLALPSAQEGNSPPFQNESRPPHLLSTTTPKKSLGSGLRSPESHSNQGTHTHSAIGMKLPKPMPMPSAGDFAKITKARSENNSEEDASSTLTETPQIIESGSAQIVASESTDTEAPQPKTESAEKGSAETTKRGKNSPDGKRDQKGFIIPDSPLKSLPKKASIHYLENRFGLPGVLEWQINDNHYKLSLTINLPIKKIQYVSEGMINNNPVELQPLHYQEFQGGKLYREAIFTYGETPLISYGKAGENKKDVPLKPGAQDTLSITWQLAIKGGILSGSPQITNGKKVYEYPIQSMEGQSFDVDNGKLRAQPFVVKYDKKTIEAWLAPDFANIPIRIKISSPSLDLQVREIEIDNIPQWVRPIKQIPTRQK